MRILANYGYKTNGDSYSVTFETIGDVPAAQAQQTVDELFRLAKEAVQRQLAGTGPTPSAQPSAAVTIPQPQGAAPTFSAPPAPQPVVVNGNGRKPQIKDPERPATPKQINLLQRLAKQQSRWLPELTDLTMGEASLKIGELMAH